MIYTVITHQGISPTDSKKLILRPMEMALRSITGIKQLKSYAFEGSGVILIEFHAGFDSDKALQDVRAKINDTEHELPKDTDKPVIKEINLSLFPVLNIILTGNIPQDSLINIARDLRDKVENVQDVLSVDISGDREDIVEVIINPETLNYYGFNLSQIKQMIAENNSLIAVGKVKNEGGSFSVKIPSTVESVNELNDFPIFSYKNKVIKLKDIAVIKKTYKDPEYIARVNGTSAIVLEVTKRTGANIISTISQVKEVVKNQQK